MPIDEIADSQPDSLDNTPKFMESWIPKVLDYVRVRLSMECPYWNKEWPDSVGGGGHHLCHRPDKHGSIARVLYTNHPSNDGHRFRVTFKEGDEGHYAAIELEPVDDSESKF